MMTPLCSRSVTVRVRESHSGAVILRFCAHRRVSGDIEKGSVESTHKVPTSHYHTKHCHEVVDFVNVNA